MNAVDPALYRPNLMIISDEDLIKLENPDYSQARVLVKHPECVCFK